MKRLVTVLQSIDDRLKTIETTLPAMCSAINDVAAVVAAPTGFVTCAGKVNTTGAAIKEAFNGRALMDLGPVTLEAQFSQAVYMGLRPEHNKALEELFSEAALEQLRSVLNEGKNLDQLIRQSEGAIKTAGDALALVVREGDLDTYNEVRDHVNEVEERIDRKLAETEAIELRLEKAFTKIDSSVKKAEALAAQAGNLVTAKSNPSKSFVSIKRNG